MLTFFGIVLGIIISALWIFLPLKKIPQEHQLKKSRYITSIIVGATLCTAVIIVLELSFDKITGISAQTPETFPQVLIVSFLRAALIEEGIKFCFVKLRLKKDVPPDKLQYMLLSGTIGMGYAIVEKIDMASGTAMIFNAVFALHTVYQFIMGAYLYEADKAEDKKLKTIFSLKAFFVPFILHGVWDSIEFGSTLYITDDMTVSSVISVLIFFAAAVGALAGEILMIRHLKRMKIQYTDETSETEVPTDAGTTSESL